MADQNNNNGNPEDEWAAAMAEQRGGSSDDNDSMQMEEFDGSSNTRPSEDAELNFDVIMDVPVHISMEIGRTEINIRNLLQLNQGSIVELDRLAGEPLDVLVNGTLIARGEVVVINEKFGIRMNANAEFLVNHYHLATGN